MDTQASTFPPTVNITPKPQAKIAEGWACITTIKGTRESVLSKIAASALSDAKKASLTEDVNEIAAEHELIRVDFHRHAHAGGWNTTHTAMPL